MSVSQEARNLLYQDQQEAMLRRSLVEEELLKPRTSLLQAPKLKATIQSGTGFAAGQKSTPDARLAAEQAKVMKKDGVILIENVLTPETADQLRAYVLDQQQLALAATQANPSKARSFYGVEQARANRCDLQLSLLRGGYKADGDHDLESAIMLEGNNPIAESHVLADALQELLGEKGTLRDLYETLVTLQGELYELAAVVTHPGSQRQIIHPDLPFQKTAPLYVVFLALQDVTEEMGPTSFLLKTHTASQNTKFSSGDVEVKNAQLSESDCRLSCLKKGDCVVFDARILHCGNANVSVDKPRALFNFSFRNPKVEGSLGYEGSIRPGYCEAMSLADVGAALVAHKKGDPDPFRKYGSGLL
ncbi:hypothetical protein ACA910_004937 [Epithemia clementina (nom. ined.)]